VQSKVNKGSTFIISLPVNQPTVESNINTDVNDSEILMSGEKLYSGL
jgi:hypothetical protein